MAAKNSAKTTGDIHQAPTETAASASESALGHEQQQNPDTILAGERPFPYKATVAVSLAVLHKAIGSGTADMLKPVGSLQQGAAVTATARNCQYVQLKNSLYILEEFLTA